MTCTTTTDTCSDCYPQSNRELKNDNCICKERFYDSKVDPVCKGIFSIFKLDCDKTCLTCDGEN